MAKVLKALSITLILLLSSQLNPCDAWSRQNHEKKQDKTQFFGPATLENKTIDNIEVLGPLQAQNIKAKKLQVMGPMEGRIILARKLTAHGPTKISDSRIDQIEVYGPTTLNDSIISGKTHIKGPLSTDENSSFNAPVVVFGSIDAKDTTFAALTTCYGDKNTFENVSGQKLIVRKTDSKDSQIVVLVNSKFDEITFESGKGQIESDSSSNIGKITGGKITGN